MLCLWACSVDIAVLAGLMPYRTFGNAIFSNILNSVNLLFQHILFPHNFSRRCGACVYIQFLKDGFQVSLNRVGSDDQFLRDFPVR